MDAGENHSLNALRALSAIVVVVAHVRAAALMSREDFAPTRIDEALYLLTSLSGGAVMVFFVLSGYFVGGSVLAAHGRGSFSWTAYLLARATRLWIVLVPALVLTWIADAIGRGVQPDHYGYTESQTNSLPDLLGNIVFLQSTHIPPFGSNSALWSLTFEAYYYVAFPLIVALLLSKGMRKMIGAVSLVAVVLSANVAVWSLFPLWLMGMAVAYWEADVRRWTSCAGSGRVRLMRAAAVVAVAVSLLLDRLIFQEAGIATWASYVLGIAVAALIATLLLDPWAGGWAGRGIRPLSRYAHSSYSLYAVHLPLAVLAVALINPTPTRTGPVGAEPRVVARGGRHRNCPARGWLAVRLVHREAHRLRPPRGRAATAFTLVSGRSWPSRTPKPGRSLTR